MYSLNIIIIAVACATPVSPIGVIQYTQWNMFSIKGKVVMLGCPKFDDVPDYIQKFADIFNRADIKSITVVVMEVPCCQGLPMILEKAMEKSGKKIPMEKVVISARGDVQNREKLAA